MFMNGSEIVEMYILFNSCQKRIYILRNELGTKVHHCLLEIRYGLGHNKTYPGLIVHLFNARGQKFVRKN